ncbi:flavin reductase family protein [Cryptosporangium aurantiacum]|uniref:Flavin reductase (NADH) n=1 Tax=Cryptosporangium aurantiacum TaxID=134849 RepID=A0A1M7Q9P7_9ACTN|nr:flavin reductase family protein [Cryptosporangium aurantiacum]SHN27404.1 flavin reductase (NADH) [Cryptosporangium aurantiacum]
MTNTSADQVKSALARFATGVAVLSVRDGRPPDSAPPGPDVVDPDEDFDDPADDIAATLTAFMPVSLFPPIVAISADLTGYVAEVLQRRAHWGLSVLSSGQAALAGRFAAAGRPSARLLLAGEEHHRGPLTGALLLDRATATIECVTIDRRPVGDHLLVTASVVDVTAAGPKDPLVRYDRAYRGLTRRD